MGIKQLNKIFLLFFFSAQSFAIGTRGQLMASGGVGQTFSPRLFLINAQIEKVIRPNLFIGGLFQLATLGGTLGTLSFSTRLLLGDHPEFRPHLELGIGLAAGDISKDSWVGVLLHSGLGIDYWFTPDMSVGTLLRLHFAPPLTNAFVSFPFLVGRFLL